jgi:hypothetical protein
MQTAPSDLTAQALAAAGNIGRKHPLMAPIDVSRITGEKGVKTLIKRLLDFHQYFHWMPAANGYGTSGVSDHCAVKHGVFLAVEAKFGANKPSPLQKQFALNVTQASGFAFCVNEKNIDHLAMWLESFEIATQLQSQGKDIPDDHGARMLNAISALTEMFKS